MRKINVSSKPEKQRVRRLFMSLKPKIKLDCFVGFFHGKVVWIDEQLLWWTGNTAWKSFWCLHHTETTLVGVTKRDYFAAAQQQSVWKGFWPKSTCKAGGWLHHEMHIDHKRDSRNGMSEGMKQSYSIFSSQTWGIPARNASSLTCCTEKQSLLS